LGGGRGGEVYWHGGEVWRRGGVERWFRSWF
jgi:hypothetical protein